MNKPYLAYRPSGIEWIGEIPEHWEVKRLKWVLTAPLKYGANEVAELDDPANPRYIRITDFDGDGKLRDDTFKSLPTEIGEEYFLKEGDILFARSGATVGKTFQFKEYEGKACFAGYLIKASPNENEVLSDFLYNYTRSNSYDNWKNSIFNQATIQNIGADKYEVLPLVIPPLPEQHAIARYLDDKTKKIDTLIEKKERLIELLKEQRTAIINQAVTKGINPNVKMKDSGISAQGGCASGAEWLGEIPEHWDVAKLKSISSIKYGLGQPPPEKENGVAIVRATNVERGKIVQKDMLYVDPKEVPYDRDPILKENDIIVVRSGAYTGDSAIVPKEYEGAITGYDMVVRVHKAEPKFIAYTFLSQYVLNHQFDLCRMRAAQPHINAEELGDTLILLPSNGEQEIIVKHIQSESERIETICRNYERNIELLQEYRAALISEVVTGKIDVREQVQYKELEEKEWLLAAEPKTEYRTTTQND